MDRIVDFVLIGSVRDIELIRPVLIAGHYEVASITGGEPSKYAADLILNARAGVIAVGFPDSFFDAGVVRALVTANSNGKISIYIPSLAELKTDPLQTNGLNLGLEQLQKNKLPAHGNLQYSPEQEIYVSEGEFIRGTSDKEEQYLLQVGGSVLPIEKPQRQIYLDSFYIDKYPVTNKDYKTFVEMSGYEPEGIRQWGIWEKYYDVGKEAHPVVCVSWQDILAYCDWAGKRLPTEAEWEKAARGTDGRIFPWGNELDEGRCNATNYIHAAKNEQHTSSIDNYPNGKSPYGCYDMVGNVWEIVRDWLDIGDGLKGTYYSVAPYQNPSGPTYGDIHVMRGGAFSTHIANCRCAFRIGPDSDTPFDRVGFRCARDAM